LLGAELFMEHRFFRLHVLHDLLVIYFFRAVFNLSEGYFFEFTHDIEYSIRVEETFGESLAFIKHKIYVHIIQNVLLKLAFELITGCFTLSTGLAWRRYYIRLLLGLTTHSKNRVGA